MILEKNHYKGLSRDSTVACTWALKSMKRTMLQRQIRNFEEIFVLETTQSSILHGPRACNPELGTEGLCRGLDAKA